MSRVFADTSFYVALLDTTDSFHTRAITLAGSLEVTLLTSEHVLFELAAFFSRESNRAKFVALYGQIMSDPATELIFSSKDLFESSMDLYSSRGDKDWSLADCASFVIMSETDTFSALSSDHHFEQAGFEILLK